MLQIRLSKGSSGEAAAPSGGGGGGSAVIGAGTPVIKAATEGVTVACPDHLVIADLPVAKSLGAVTVSATAAARTIGRRSRRPLGERVHICSRCDFPVAIYGRLTPCEHAFCLACSRSDSSCYLCEERIQKIQSVKMMEGIFICAAPHCLKSFLKRTEFETHIQEFHSNLLNSSQLKQNATESDTQKDTTLKPESSTARGSSSRPGFSPTSSSQIHRENSNPKFAKSDQEKIEMPFIYPPLSNHHPNFPMPMNMNINQQFFMNPYQVQLMDPGMDPGSIMGMQPAPWGMGMMNMQMGNMGNMEGVANQADQVHGGMGFLQGVHGDNNGDNKGVLANLQMQLQMPMSMAPSTPQMPPASMQMHFNR